MFELESKYFLQEETQKAQKETPNGRAPHGDAKRRSPADGTNTTQGAAVEATSNGLVIAQQ